MLFLLRASTTTKPKSTTNNKCSNTRQQNTWATAIASWQLIDSPLESDRVHRHYPWAAIWVASRCACAPTAASAAATVPWWQQHGRCCRYSNACPAAVAGVVAAATVADDRCRSQSYPSCRCCHCRPRCRDPRQVWVCAGGS